MSALNKMMGFLGLVDTDEETMVSEVPARAAVARPSRERTGVTVLGSHHQPATSQPALIEDSSSYNIITLQPRSYSEARKVGEFYREGNPVIINLDDME
jgi:cell division inhibitor SepF